MAAGSGEEVSGDYRDYIARQDLGTIKRLYARGGHSDQRTAYLRATIQQREAGISQPVPITNFQEARTVEDVQTEQAMRTYQQAGYTSQQASVLARASQERGQSLTLEESQRVIQEQQLYSNYKAQGYSESQARNLAAVSVERGQSLTQEEEKKIVELQPRNINEQRIASQYYAAGYSREESIALARVSSERRQSLTSDQAQQIAQQIRADQPYPSPSEDVTGYLAAGNEDVTMSLERERKDIQALSLPDISIEAEAIASRQKLPFFERISFAYKSAGVTQYGEPNIRGIIRAGFETVIIGQEKLGIPVISKVTIPSSIVENVGITALFSGIATPTTSQLRKEIFEISKVRVGGINQVIKQDIIDTEAIYSVERAGKVRQGIVSARTLKIAQTEEAEFVITGARGTDIKRIINLPTTKTTFKTSGAFKSVEIAEVRNKESLTFIKSVGETISREGKASFRSGAINIQREEFTLQLGGTVSTRGNAVSVGVIKTRQTGNNIVDIIGNFGKRPSANLKQIQKLDLGNIALEQVKSSVRASVQIKPQPPVNIKPITSLALPSIKQQSQTLPQTQPLKIKETPVTIRQFPRIEQITKQTTTVSYFPRQQELPRLKELTKQKTLQEQTQTQREVLRQKEVLVQTPKIKTLLKTRLIQETPQITTIKLFPKTPRIPQRNIPLIPIKLRGLTSIPKQSSFTVFLRRFGKFRPIGTFATQQKAFRFGQFAAGTTLGVTFKVDGKGVRQPLSLRGFRRKETKQGTFFIELPKFRLSTGSEIREIQTARRRR